jgi:hypothetical protein
MENFSTNRPALVPRATNLATLAVVVAATWWSGAQRPMDPLPLARTTPAVEAGHLAALPMQQSAELAAAAPAALPNAANTTPVQSSVFWPAQAAVNVAREGLQAVGFRTGSQR